MAVANVLPKLLSIYLAPESSEDLQVKTKKALKNILQKCIHLPALEPLLQNAPPNILKHVVAQFAKVLPHDAKARKLFVTSGGLKKIQEIKAEQGSSTFEYINTINNSYPEEIVKLVFCFLKLPSREFRCLIFNIYIERKPFRKSWVICYMYIHLYPIDIKQYANRHVGHTIHCRACLGTPIATCRVGLREFLHFILNIFLHFLDTTHLDIQKNFLIASKTIIL